MKEREMDKIMAFDTLFTNNQIQMYKILLSYLQPALQQKFAIYIKFMELQYTMNFFKTHPQAALKALSPEEPQSRNRIFDEIMPLCTPTQREQLNHMKGVLQNFENMQEMMEMLQMMKDFFPEGMGNGNNDGCGGGMDMTQLFSMLGSSDTSGIFDMFNNFSSFEDASSSTDSQPQ